MKKQLLCIFVMLSMGTLYALSAPPANDPPGFMNDLPGLFGQNSEGVRVSEPGVQPLLSRCAAYPIPYSENFDSYGWGSFPDCWTMNGQGTFTAFIRDNFSASPPLSFRIYNGWNSSLYLSLPQLDADLSALQLRFMALYQGGHQILEVGVMSDPADLESFVLVESFTLPAQQVFLPYIVYFNDIQTPGVITFRMAQENAAAFWIDDLLVEVAPDCRPPYALTLQEAQLHSATIAWSQFGEAQSWDLRYGPRGFDPVESGTLITNVIQTTYEISSLDASTEYQVYIRAHCGEESSGWSAPLSFATLCDVFPVPLLEQFDAVIPPLLPLCWDVVSASAPGFFDVRTGNFPNQSHPYSLQLYHQQEHGLALTAPEVNIDIQNLVLRFYARLMSGNTLLEAGVITDVDDPGSFVPVHTFSLSIKPWFEDHTVYFDSYQGEGGRIALRYGGSQVMSWGNMYLDDIRIEQAPLCPEPYALSYGEVTETSVFIEWLHSGEAASFDVLYGPRGFDPESDGTLISGITASHYTFYGLEPASYYQAYVRAHCGDETSAWSLPVEFASLCVIFELPVFENFDQVIMPELPLCWEAAGKNYYEASTQEWPNYSSPYSLFLYHANGAEVLLIAPEFEIATEGIMVSLMASWNWGNRVLEVGWLTDESDIDSFVLGELITLPEISGFFQYFALLPEYTGAEGRLAIRYGNESDYGYVYLDDINIDFMPACAPPMNLLPEHITGSTALISWSQFGEAQSWDVAWGYAGFQPGVEGQMQSGIQAMEYLIEGLSGQLHYEVYVRAHCPEDISLWSAALGFVTPCDVVSVPFSENFDQGPLWGVPGCWYYSGYAYAGWQVAIIDHRSYSYPYSLQMYQSGYSYALLATPPIAEEIGLLRLRFRAQRNEWSPDTWLQIGTMSDADDAGSFTEYQSVYIQKHQEGDWHNFSIMFNAYEGTDTHIAFRLFDDSGNWSEVFIDNVHVHYIPSCLEPADLFVSETAQNSALLNWTEQAGAGLWDIAWGPGGFEPGTGGNLIEGVSEMPYLLEGLSASMSYEFYVRAVCGEEVSEWSEPGFFMTDCGMVSLPFGQNFDQTPAGMQPACWQIMGQGNTHGAVSGEASASSPHSLFMYQDWNSYLQFFSPEMSPGGPFKLSFKALRHWDSPVVRLFVGMGEPITQETYTVTFDVDMTGFDFDAENDQIYVTGSMLGWAMPGTDPDNQLLSRVGESMIWRREMQLAAGQYEYKYFLNYGWDYGEWGGGPNRVISVWDDLHIQDQWAVIAKEQATPTAPKSFTEHAMLSITNKAHWSGQHDPWQEFVVYIDGVEEGEHLIFMLGEPEANYWSMIFMDDIWVEEAPDCPEPYNLHVSEVRTQSAIVSWLQYGEASLWDVKYGYQGFDPATEGLLIEGVSAASLLLEELDPGSWYSVYVRARCDQEVSEWSLPVKFMTKCAAQPLPLFESFDMVNTPALPVCWDVVVQGQGNFEVETRSGNAYSPENALYIHGNWDARVMLLLPELDWAIDDLMISFKLFCEWGGTTLTVGVMEDMYDMESFHIIEVLNLSEQHHYLDYRLFTANYEGPSGRIVLMYPPEYNSGSIYLDDIRVEAIPSCAPPYNLAAEDIDQHEVLISWMQFGEAQLWELKWGTPGFNPDMEGTLISGIEQTQVMITGLNHSTDYQVYVRAICEEQESSLWSSPIQFQSACGPLSIPYWVDFEDVEVYQMPLCWSHSIMNTWGEVFVLDHRYHSPNHSLRISHGEYGYAMIAMPPLPLDLRELKIELRSAIGLTPESGWLHLGTMSDPDDPDSFSLLESWQISQRVDQEWHALAYSFHEYQGSDTYIALRAGSLEQEYWSRVFIDDVLIDLNDQPRYALSLEADPPVGGQVFGEGQFMEGTLVTVSAVENSGYTFGAWMLGGESQSTEQIYSFAMPAGPITLVGQFEPILYPITAEVSPEGAGTINGTGMLPFNSMQSLTAIPDEAYLFVAWYEGEQELGTEAELEFLVTGPRHFAANFVIKTYNLSYLAGENGSLTGETTQTVEHGSDGSPVTAVPATGYHFVQWSDGSMENPRTDLNVTADLEVTAHFAINTYTLTYLAGENGSLTGETTQTVNHGSDGTPVTAVPATGYHFVQWSDENTDNPRSDTNVTADLTVTAEFEINTYTITATASANGQISPAGETQVTHGSNLVFTLTPNTGYHLAALLVNGEPVEPVSPFTLSNITQSGTIHAEFAINVYIIEATAGAGGSISPSGDVEVNHGSNQPFTITPDTGYHITDVSVNGISIGAVASYVFVNVTANASISAQFAINTYTLTYLAGANGSLTGETTQTVNHGSNGSPVTAVPATGYHFAQWSDGSTANPRTDTNVTANLTVTAQFVINTYTLTYLAGANGSLTGETTQTVEHGSDGTPVTAVPATGYHFSQWSDGSTANPRTDTNVTADLTVTAHFAESTFVVSFHVNMVYITADLFGYDFDPEADLVYVTGNMAGEWPVPGSDDAQQLMVAGGDDPMIYSLSLDVLPGTYEYKYFLNAGWDGGEWTGGDNRSFTLGMENLELHDWFGSLTDPTGIQQPAELAVKVYPVPARDHLLIESSHIIKDVQLVNMLGREVYRIQPGDKLYRLSVSDLPPGIYFVRVMASDQWQTLRIQIAR